MKNIEAIVVGGGPAGAVCAGRLKDAGIDVVVLDKDAFPRQKPCAGWVTPEVFRILDCSPGAYPFGLTHFTSFITSIKGIRFKLKVNQYAIRRIEFDDWLIQRSGVRIENHQVKNITQVNGGYEVDDTYRCKWLIGAGGTRCPVQRKLFKQQHPRPIDALITALEVEFPYAYTNSLCHLWFFDNKLPGYAWYVPKTGGFVNVGVGGKFIKLHRMGITIKDYWLQLVEKLEKEGLVEKILIKPRAWTYYLRHKGLHGRIGNAFIIGDSLGLATLDMGEGIRTAIESGKRAAEAIIKQKEYEISTLPKYSASSILKR